MKVVSCRDLIDRLPHSYNLANLDTIVSPGIKDRLQHAGADVISALMKTEIKSPIKLSRAVLHTFVDESSKTKWFHAWGYSSTDWKHGISDPDLTISFRYPSSTSNQTATAICVDALIDGRRNMNDICYENLQPSISQTSRNNKTNTPYKQVTPSTPTNERKRSRKFPSVIVIAIAAIIAINIIHASTSRKLSGRSEDSPPRINHRVGTVAAGTVAVRLANIRSGPSTNNPVIGKAQRGDRVEILRKQNNWFFVKIKKQQGWISGTLIRQDRRGTQQGTHQLNPE